MRCLRPDRMTYAVLGFVEEKLGTKYVDNKAVEFAKSFEESGPSTPIFFILSPGVNPLKGLSACDVRRILGFLTPSPIMRDSQICLMDLQIMVQFG